MYTEFCDTPFGIVKMTASSNTLMCIERVQHLGKSRPNKVTRRCARELTAYANHKLKRFSGVPIPKGTNFQKKVWTAISDIPYGKTQSYAEIAKKIKRPRAVRAVGTAIGKNPLCIIIPCHRVIKSDGSYGAYAYGPKMKRVLLLHEQQ